MADPILLSLFANRFMSMLVPVDEWLSRSEQTLTWPFPDSAEAMGRSLQQTAISTNIKGERFSLPGPHCSTWTGVQRPQSCKR